MRLEAAEVCMHVFSDGGKSRTENRVEESITPEQVRGVLRRRDEQLARIGTTVKTTLDAIYDPLLDTTTKVNADQQAVEALHQCQHSGRTKRILDTTTRVDTNSKPQNPAYQTSISLPCRARSRPRT